MIAPQKIANPVKLQLFGAFALRCGDGKQIEISSKKNRALLAILALSPGLHATRERLAGLLWGDRGDDQARDSLRQSIAVLRKELAKGGLSILNLRGDLVELQAEAMIIDTVEFYRIENDEAAEPLRTAAVIYNGELLSDLAVHEAGFEDWLASERRRLNTTAIGLFDRLTLLESGQAQIETASRLVALDQLREASHRRLMDAYASQGEIALALQQFETCKKLLHVELGVEPAPETQEMRRQIRDREYRPAKIAAASSGLSQSPQASGSHTSTVLPSLAVLPFQNIGGDSTQNYFADGVVEDIITALSRFKSFAVIARNATFAYKNRIADFRQVASELGVRYVMNGSVRRADNKLRIAAHLVDCQTGSNLWAENFDGTTSDIFDFQDRITAIVAMLVEPKIQAAEIERSKRERPGSMAIYDVYLQVLPKLASDVDSDSAEAFALLLEALKIEPNNALLLALAVRVIDFRNSQGKEPLAPENIKQCAEWAYRGLQFAAGDSSVMVYCGLALIQTVKDYDLGMAVIQTAVDNNPNSLMVVARAGVGHLLCGSLDLAIAYFQRAIQLTPNNVEAHYSMTGIAHAHMILGQFSEAIKWATLSLALNSQYDPTYWMLIASHAQLGHMEEAKKYLITFQKFAPHVTIAKLRQGQASKDPNRHATIFEGLRLAGFPKA